MLLGFGQIVHNAFPLQMRGQRAAATRLCSGAAGRRGRSFVIGTGSIVLRQIFDVHSLSFQLRFEQRQLCVGNLLTALSAAGREQLPEQVLGFDSARLGGVQLRDQIEHHPAQCVCVGW